MRWPKGDYRNMQNRYAGDIGDFGKLGLLRALRGFGLSIGVNWYLVPDENHNDDGRFVQYLQDDSFRQCDESLWLALNSIVSGQRGVSALQDARLLDASYYSDVLDLSGKSKAERRAFREVWHEKALTALSGLDVVFVDPDNGLIVPSAVGTTKENKFVTLEELADYYGQGSSVIYYQHKARVSDEVYKKKHRDLLAMPEFDGSAGLCLKFYRTSLRYYFFIIQPRHQAAITAAVNQLLASPWSSCFR